MKKYYEKPFVMLLDVPGTNPIVESTLEPCNKELPGVNEQIEWHSKPKGTTCFLEGGLTLKVT